MPIFEYRCSACGHKFEDVKVHEQADQVGDCPKCGKAKVERVMSAFSCGCGGASSSPLGSGAGPARKRGG
jgi:putative FmdB family regulatory protein